ncbi:ABC transporter ATP-binding protein/permease [Paenibacillus sp. N1-5-1-14]|uniref:ABC transporter ATP-binding protein n=1 Tax=Paenibacillus radicibacter TaxID=2972488 RepID=UPI0021594D99|nr:ABC transporter ATP-binding protein [Paenibacillus radicibacter]MCR8642622.1 ABC transporter ATP-binding protein/permease [Paenibacillus radicibacter]
MLAITVAAELTGPFIAKTMIDTHILGIEKKWYVVTNPGSNPSYEIDFRGKVYIRGDRIPEGQPLGQEVRVLQAGRQFALIESPLVSDGERKINGDTLVVTKAGQSTTYPAYVLSGTELYQFYKPEIQGLVKLILIYLGLLIVASVFQFGEKYVMQTSANRVIQRMRGDVYKQIHRMPINYFDNLPAGKVVSRVTNDTEAVKDLFVTVLAQFFSGSIYMIGILGALFLLDYKLGLACMVVIPILFVWIVVYRKFASKYNRVIRSRLSDMNGMLNESIQGMPIIRAFRRGKETKQEFEELNEDYYQHQRKMQRLNSLTSHNLVGVLRNAAFVLLIWYFGGASLGVGTVISVGVLYAFIDYMNRLFQPIVGMVNQLATLESSLVSAERVFELMDQEGTDVAEGTLPRYKGNVKFDQVTFAYIENENVLKNISFEAKQGQTVALVGHTGSGKSSIMNLLFRFYDVNQGKVTIDGKDVKDIPKQMLRQHMGIVLQDPFLFTGTIANNVSLNDPAITREKVDAALNAVGAKRVLNNLPNGFDEPVIEKGSTLSAGQRQIISFARALAFDPAILILDEATASIDTETEAVIQDALEVLKKGRTTFIIAHRLSTIRSADQILVLHRGEIVERGNHEELMAQKGRYFNMYQLQQGGGAAPAPTLAPASAAAVEPDKVSLRAAE